MCINLGWAQDSSSCPLGDAYKYVQMHNAYTHICVQIDIHIHLYTQTYIYAMLHNYKRCVYDAILDTRGPFQEQPT